MTNIISGVIALSAAFVIFVAAYLLEGTNWLILAFGAAMMLFGIFVILDGLVKIDEEDFKW